MAGEPRCRLLRTLNFRRTTTNTAPHTEPPEKNQFSQKNQLPCPNFNCFFLLMHSLHTTFAPNTARCTFANSRVGTNSGLEENQQMINSAEWRLRRRPKAQHSGAQETWCTVLLHFEQLWCGGAVFWCTLESTGAVFCALLTILMHGARLLVHSCSSWWKSSIRVERAEKLWRTLESTRVLQLKGLQ